MRTFCLILMAAVGLIGLLHGFWLLAVSLGIGALVALAVEGIGAAKEAHKPGGDAMRGES